MSIKLILWNSYAQHGPSFFGIFFSIPMSVCNGIRWGYLIDFAWKFNASLNSIVVLMWYLVNRWESCKVANILLMWPYDNERGRGATGHEDSGFQK